jgi:hypothetical protein
MRAILPLLGFAALLLSSPLAHAQVAPASLDAQPEPMRAGQFVWTPENAPDGPVLIHVDLSRQLVSVYRNGVRIGVSTTSSGRRGFETPAGVFTILQKNARHRSNLYNNAPMPYMLRLTWDGVALHGGYVPARPVSHGCLRLPMAFARELFRITATGTTVVVEGAAGEAPAAPAVGVLTPAREGGSPEVRTMLQRGQSYAWTPELMPTGPVSIVLSRTDQQVVVLRNGVEIGRARALIPTDLPAQAFAVAADTEGAWASVDLLGAEAPEEERGLARVRLPIQFESAARSVLAGGATALITDARVADDAGTEVAVAAPVSAFDMER